MALATSTPYAWPWDGSIDPSRLALLVISSLPTSTPAGLLTSDDRVAELSSVGAPKGAPTGDQALALLTQDLLPQDLLTQDLLTQDVLAAGGIVVNLVCQTDGAAIPAGHLGAPKIDGFYESTLDYYLRSRGRDQLLLVGEWLETTVHSTLRSANDRGYECLIVEDLCASYDPDLRKGSLSSIEMSGGIFGAIDNSANLRTLLKLS